MKRGAERQLTKDDSHEDEVDEVDPGQGFKKAEQKILAARPMKGLPRRVGTSSPAPPLPLTPSASLTPEPTASAPKFAGFAGFGASASASTPFSFSAPTKPTVPPSSTDGLLPASIPSSSTTTSSVFPASTSAPSVASTASAATKTFASFLGSSASAPTEPKPQVRNGSGPEDANLKAETQYYCALRGLNVSALHAITKAIESDPFCDISQMLERYKSLRQSAQNVLDESVKNVSASPTPTSTASTPAPIASATFSFNKSSTEATSKSAPGMPSPPPTFSGFGGFGSSSSSTTTSVSSKPGGFVPSSMPASLSFGPGATSASDGASPAPSKSAFPSSNSSPFGAPSGSAFKFGGDSSKPSESKSGFSFGSSSTPSVFSSNLFGGESSEDKDKEKSKDKDGEKDKAISASTSMSGFFGSTPPTPSAGFSTPEKPSPGSPTSGSGFVFGAASPVKTTNVFGGFGKPTTGSGSFGNPVGWQFASPPRDGEGASSSAPAAASSSSSSRLLAFSFGGPAPATKSTEVSEGEVSEGATPTPEDQPPTLESKSSVHDLDGEGEEDETTAHEIRSKVYKLVKDEKGVSAWKDLGIGLLKVKVNKDSGTRRLLLRNSSTGKVTINFNIYKSMDPSVSKNTVSFIGHEEGAAVPYRLRVKTSEQAHDLKKTLDREIEFVKAKSAE